MNGSLLAGLTVGGVVVTAVGAYASTPTTAAGYQVTCLLDGQRGMVRVDHDPGERIRAEDGELVLARP